MELMRRQNNELTNDFNKSRNYIKNQDLLITSIPEEFHEKGSSDWITSRTSKIGNTERNILHLKKKIVFPVRLFI